MKTGQQNYQVRRTERKKIKVKGTEPRVLWRYHQVDQRIHRETPRKRKRKGQREYLKK